MEGEERGGGGIIGYCYNCLNVLRYLLGASSTPTPKMDIASIHGLVWISLRYTDTGVIYPSLCANFRKHFNQNLAKLGKLGYNLYKLDTFQANRIIFIKIR